MSRAFIFPGQGAQTIGMGRALADAYPAARAVFDEVDEALGEQLSALIWEGEQEHADADAERAARADGDVAGRAARARGRGRHAGRRLLSSRGIRWANILRWRPPARSAWPTPRAFCASRGRAMQEAVPVGEGAMAAMLGLDFGRRERRWPPRRRRARFARPPTTMIRGRWSSRATRPPSSVRSILAKARGAKRAMLLPVSAPFHCALMQPAAEVMRAALEEVPMDAPAVPLVANVRASGGHRPRRDPRAAGQPGHGRRSAGAKAWNTWPPQGVTETWEIGAGKALSGMVRRIEKDIAVRNIGTPEDVAAAAEALKNG